MHSLAWLALLVAPAAMASTTPPTGVFYSPVHSSPISVFDTLENDFALLQPYYSVVRTAFPTFGGIDIAPIASQFNMSLYIGITPDGNSTCFDDQVAAVVRAIQLYPVTIAAVFVGSDNLQPFGNANATTLQAQVLAVKARIWNATKTNVPVGTSQRLESWLNPLTNISGLAAAVDILGLQMYPYLYPAYSADAPLALVQQAWTNLSTQFPFANLQLTETGYPTQTESLPVNPTLSVANAKIYFDAVSQSAFGGFWASFFDDNTAKSRVGMPQVHSFGLFTAAGVSKGLLPSLTPSHETGGLMGGFTPGVCYSPFHNAEYPLNGGAMGNLGGAIDADFNLMSKYFGVVRTYYSSYMGIGVAQYAAKYNVKLFLGVFMTTESWYGSQVSAAVAAGINYPNSISAILVGNENVAPYGPFSATDIMNSINSIRTQLRAANRNIPIGTVQRACDWLDPANRNNMLQLAAASDVIGVNIYPFFDNGYQSSNPLVILQAVWNQLTAIFPPSKLRLTEIGFSTGGAPSVISPRVLPSLSNSILFYNAFQNWQPAAGGGEAFWYTMFDLRPDDRTQPAELEKYFGFFTWQHTAKAANFPLPRQAGAVLPAPQPPSPPITTTAPPPPPPPAPVSNGFTGVLYSPFHADEYPNDVNNLAAAITLDLQVIRARFPAIRTAYANFYGIDIAPFAAAFNLQLYLGVGMTRENWYPAQVASAVAAVKYFPSTVAALIVGNECAYTGDYFVGSDIVNAISALKAQVKAQTGRVVPMGTVQRASEWLNPAFRNDMIALGAACDVIGVTLSLFDTDNLTSPATTLQRYWTQLTAIYPASKLQLMDVGFPTAGANSGFNTAGLTQAQAFYAGTKTWTHATPLWYSAFYDNKATATTDTKRFYGFFNAQRQPKAANYPTPVTGTG
ncbi:Aste57867_4372 [Aphanomyces stellatus]|uniref:glucan endo-1,3-beta-D-glucosidase n=1 Tax=Aphanomyces stellatus TaxID=120398 RepID=A0A485KFT7_9STRA|nr:hypothetical protein As57867_004360 [Aphanomyces stellatus]VFT81486.1 Aste57867_4372 [Aphanomyces stellatus]